MTRFKLIVEYDGAPFVGWQRQDNGPSVQQALEEAVAGFSGIKTTCIAAGRTDAGVHALGQVVHFDLAREMRPDKLADAVNAHLRPAPISVVAARIAEPDFHSRFQAYRRHYSYRIVNRRAPLALERGRAWFVPQPLDAAAMHAAAQVLIGKHDFSSFRAAECQADSPVKTLERLTVTRDGDAVTLDVSAPSFLHRQVRNLTGTLALVGQGKWDRTKLAQVLAARDRRAAGPTAPAEGLYLVAVDYP